MPMLCERNDQILGFRCQIIGRLIGERICVDVAVEVEVHIVLIGIGRSRRVEKERGE